MAAPPERLGAQCEADCSTVDFLPVVCPGCKRVFCAAHQQAAAHACPNWDVQAEDGSKFDQKFADLLPDRSEAAFRRAMEPPVDTEAQRKKDAMLAVLAKNFPAAAGGTGKSAAGTKKKEESPVIRLMKLKQRALSADPRKKAGDVSIQDRLFCVARWEDKTKDVWFVKDVSVGKALDLLATAFGLANVNNDARVPEKHLHLALDDGNKVELTTGKKLVDQLQNGGTLLLYRGGTL